MPVNEGTALASASLKASYSPTRRGVTGGSTAGFESSESLPATEAIVFEVSLDVDFSVEIPLNTLIPSITGSTGQPQIVTLTIVAPSGITSNGNLSVTIAGAHVTAGTVLVPVTTALTTESAIAAAIAADTGFIAAVADYIVGTSDADVSAEDAENRTFDSTFSISVAAGLGVSAATSVVTQTGGDPAKCYSLPGTTYSAENFEGAALSAPAAFYGISISVTGASGMAVTAGPFADELNDGECLQKHAVGGISLTPANTLTFEGLGGPATALVTLMFDT